MSVTARAVDPQRPPATVNAAGFPMLLQRVLRERFGPYGHVD